MLPVLFLRISNLGIFCPFLLGGLALSGGEIVLAEVVLADVAVQEMKEQVIYQFGQIWHVVVVSCVLLYFHFVMIAFQRFS